MLLGPILENLATFSESSGQTKIEADSLLHQMQTKKFLFLLVAFNQLFEVSDYATKGLQSSTLSVTDCIDLIEGLKDSYTQFRNENDAFDKVMALTDELMNKHEIVRWDIIGSRKRKLPARLANTHVDSTLGNSSGPPARTFPFLWRKRSTLCLCSSLKERQRTTRSQTRKKKHS